MRFEEEISKQENLQEFYDDFVKRTEEKLNKEQDFNFSAGIEQKLKQVNIFERNEKQNELIIRQERYMWYYFGTNSFRRWRSMLKSVLTSSAR
jgi:hypothetical protein